MPLIRIDSPKSFAHNSLGFEFDEAKRRSYSGKKQAIKRMEKHMHKPFWEIKNITTQNRKSKEGSWHHIDNDRSNGFWKNLFWTISRLQHTHLHQQLQELTTLMIKSGLIGFDFKTKKYFVASKWLEDHFRNWVQRGEQNEHIIEGI